MPLPIAGAALLSLAAGAYLLFAPVPVEPLAWQPPPDAGYTGPYAVNRRLAGLQRIDLGGARAPEHVALGPDGWLYAAVAGGDILRMRPDGGGLETWARTGGRVLGFDFDHQGRLIAADALRGLLAISPEAPHQVTVLADRVAADDPIRFAEAVAVTPDGTVYFTDATRRFAPADHGGVFDACVLDFVEQSATGRVLAWDPASGRVEVVAHGLSFANGIVLSRDGRALFVAETGAYRVWRIDASARKLDLKREGAGAAARVLLDALPGFPDNLTRGLDGRIWLGLAKPRSHASDAMAGHPFLRKLAVRLPQALWPSPPAHGHILAFTEDGRVVVDLQDPEGAYPDTTGALETADRLYVQSVRAQALGWLPKARTGL